MGSPLERAKLQKQFDEIAHSIEIAMNQTLDQNPELKKKVMAALFGEPKQNNN